MAPRQGVPAMTEVETTVPAPRANPRLLGQSAAESTLLAAHRSGRLPHAWLLAGPRGIGKATLAYRFARFLLAEGGQQGAGDAGLFGELPRSVATDLAMEPDHPVFRRVVAAGHPDLRAIERALDAKTGRRRQEILVKDVRAIGDFLHRTPGEGAWRIVIVDSADELNRSAANALLKALEEPPRQALLLLVSHQPGRLLPTIRSRCCRLELQPLDEPLVDQLLQGCAPDLPAAERQALGRLAGGSIGQALALKDAGGLALYGELTQLLGGLPRLDVPRVHALGDRLARDREGTAFRVTGELLTGWLDRMIRGAAEGRLPAEVAKGDAALMERLVARRSLAQWLTLWENLSRLFARSESVNLDRKQVVITAFLEFETLVA